VPRVTSYASQSFLQRFLGGLKFPQIFTLLATLFAIDFFLPDPIPFIDEIIFAALAIMLGMWKKRSEEVPLEGTPFDNKPPEKNITPPD
jgi:hypothetical protein